VAGKPYAYWAYEINASSEVVKKVAAMLASGEDDEGDPFAIPVRIVLGSPAGGSQLSPSIASVTTGGTIAAGKRYVEFIFSSDFAGSILGATFAGPRDLSYSLPFLPPGDSYGAIVYTISAGSARIVSL
jgi:hypothetical protein